MIRKEFTIVVEISDNCERAIGGGVTSRHIAAAFNLATDEDTGEVPLGQIIWAPGFKEGQPDLDDTGWYIVGVKA